MKERICKQDNEGLNFDILRLMIRQSAVRLVCGLTPALTVDTPVHLTKTVASGNPYLIDLTPEPHAKAL